MFSRAASLLIALLLSAQAFASGATVMVCRYTGKVLTDCPCPAASESARFEKQSCCELRGSAPFHVDSQVRATVQPPERVQIALALPPTTKGMISATAKRHVLPDAHGPPIDQSARYLTLRQLLI